MISAFNLLRPALPTTAAAAVPSPVQAKPSVAPAWAPDQLTLSVPSDAALLSQLAGLQANVDALRAQIDALSS
ncbi:MAG: hypothetical protein JWM80_5506, partial [Cyanobacteria bacterium RYN_339]|nr:hypothetical protein [Cyanobacteria bacterium RYN_339]